MSSQLLSTWYAGMSKTLSANVEPPDISKIDFSDHSTLLPDIYRINITFIVLVFAIVSARIAVRISIVKRLFVDDILAIVAAFLTIGLAAAALGATKFGMGGHVWHLPINKVTHIIADNIRVLYACYILYALATAFTKFSIIATYLHVILSPTSRIIIYATSTINGLLCLVSVITIIFQCSPIQSAWDFEHPRKCISFISFIYASAGINIGLDVVLVVVAIPHLWQLRLPVRQKVIVCFLFCIGAMACIASIVRITTIAGIISFDVTYRSVTSLNWSVVECALGIICISIPPLRPLAIRILPSTLVTTYLSNTYSRDIDVQLKALSLGPSGDQSGNSDLNIVEMGPTSPQHMRTNSRRWWKASTTTNFSFSARDSALNLHEQEFRRDAASGFVLSATEPLPVLKKQLLPFR